MTKVPAEDPSFAVKVRCQRLIFYNKLTVWERLNFLLFYFFFFSYWGFELFILTAQFWFRRKQLVYQPNWKELPYFLWVSNCLCSALHLALKPHVDLDVYTIPLLWLIWWIGMNNAIKTHLGKFLADALRYYYFDRYLWVLILMCWEYFIAMWIMIA